MPYWPGARLLTPPFFFLFATKCIYINNFNKIHWIFRIYYLRNRLLSLSSKSVFSVIVETTCIRMRPFVLIILSLTHSKIVFQFFIIATTHYGNVFYNLSTIPSRQQWYGMYFNGLVLFKYRMCSSYIILSKLIYLY